MSAFGYDSQVWWRLFASSRPSSGRDYSRGWCQLLWFRACIGNDGGIGILGYTKQFTFQRRGREHEIRHLEGEAILILIRWAWFGWEYLLGLRGWKSLHEIASKDTRWGCEWGWLSHHIGRYYGCFNGVEWLVMNQMDVCGWIYLCEYVVVDTVACWRWRCSWTCCVRILSSGSDGKKLNLWDVRAYFTRAANPRRPPCSVVQATLSTHSRSGLGVVV